MSDHPTKDVKKQPLVQFGKQLAMRPHGRKVQQALDAALRELPSGGVLVVDFNGVEMMDYSFADEALGTLFSRMSAKEYPDRYLILAVPDDEMGEALVENIEAALNRREVAALVLPEDSVHAVTTLPANSGEPDANSRQGMEWRVIGTLPAHLIDTLRAVMDKGEITVRELADALKLDSATACNNRIAKLYQLHLVRREAAIVPEGGRLYCYSAVV